MIEQQMISCDSSSMTFMGMNIKDNSDVSHMYLHQMENQSFPFEKIALKTHWPFCSLTHSLTHSLWTFNILKIDTNMYNKLLF